MGCQSYERQALDIEGHEARWRERSSRVEGIRAFAKASPELMPFDAERFDLEDGVELWEARWVALVFNPQLRLERLRALKAAAIAGESGLWADPVFGFNLLRFIEGVRDPWTINGNLSITLPLSGSLAAQAALREAQHQLALARVLEAEWQLSNDVGRDWIRWSAASARVEVQERWIADLEELAKSARLLAEAGEIPVSQFDLAELELVQRRNQAIGLRAAALAAERRLRQRLGLTPEAPVTFEAALDLDRDSSEPSSFNPERLTENNPTLARRRQEYEASERALEREIRKQYPDLTLAPQFEDDESQSRIGLFGSLPLPVWNRNLLGIAGARADRELARATYESEFEGLMARLATARMRRAALLEQGREFEDEVVPRLARYLERSRALYELGELGTSTLLDSVTRTHQSQLSRIDQLLAQGTLLAELTELCGPRLLDDSRTKPSTPLVTP